jgi:TRL (tRNA-associated locus)-like protein
MKGLLVVGILAVMTVAAVGCVSPTGAPIMGWIYTDVTGPGYAIDSSASFSKVGTSECSAIICVATGDASVQKAAQSVGITKIHHVDVNYMTILGLYGKVVTTVYGE